MISLGVILILILLFLFRTFQLRIEGHRNYLSIGLFYTGFVIIFYLPLLFFDLSYYDIDNNYGRLIPVTLMTFFLIGVLLFEKQGLFVFRVNRLKYEKVRAVGVILFSIILAVIGVVLYQGIPPTLSSLTSLLFGQFEISDLRAVRDFREEVTKGHVFGGEYRGQGALRIILKNGIYILVNAVLLEHLLYGEKKRLLLFVYIFAFFLLLGEGSRSPIIFLLFTNFVTFVSVKKIRLKLIFWVGQLPCLF